MTGPASADRHRDAERKLIKARQVAANALEDLAAAEDDANLTAEANEHRLQAADEEMHVADEAQHLGQEIRETQAKRAQAGDGAVGSRSWAPAQPKKSS